MEKILDKIVEEIYRVTDCQICKAANIDCPFKDYTEEDVTEDTFRECKKIIKNLLIKAVKEYE